MPGPRSMTRMSTRRPPVVHDLAGRRPAGRRPGSRGARRCRRGWPAPAPAGRRRRRPSGSVSGTSISTCAPAAPRLATAASTRLLDVRRPQLDGQRRRLQPAHVEQVADEVGEPVGLLLDRPLELVDVLRRPLDVALAEAGDRRLDRRQRRAQVVGDGLQQRAAQRVGGGEVGGLAGLALQPLALGGARRPGRRRR